MDITLRQIKYFIATAETGQISKASDVCNVTQSSITIAIRKLEDLLGYQLFVRQSKGMHLTSQGEKFLRHCHSIMQHVEDAVELEFDQEPQEAGSVRVAVTEAISAYFLPPIWRKLKTLYPEIHIEVFEVSRKEIEEGLQEGKFDVAIMLVSNLLVTGPFHVEELIASPRRLWLSSRHPLVDKETVSIHDLADENYILLTMDEHESTIRRVWEKYDFSPNVMFTSYSMEALRSMIANEMGVAIISDMVYRSWSLEGRRIVRKDLLEDMPSMDTGIVWPKGAILSPATQTFLSLLRSETLAYKGFH